MTEDDGGPAPAENPSTIIRAVTPRSRSDQADHLNIVVVGDAVVSSEHDGHQAYPRAHLPALLQEAPPSIIACHHHEQVFLQLHAALQDTPRFDWQVSIRRKSIFGVSHVQVEEVAITIIGWKGRNKRKGRWHHFLDPSHFVQYAEWAADVNLGEWAEDVRAFLREYHLTPSARAGGIAAQLLRHPEVYPGPRRQVPKFINERGRHALPGNHYQFVEGRPRAEYDLAWYLDQEAAHHHAAHSIMLPHADHLVAVGYYWGEDGEYPENRPWLATPEQIDRFLGTNPHGLLYVQLRVTERHSFLRYNGQTDPAPKWFQRVVQQAGVDVVGATATAYLYTNELDMLAEYGLALDHIIAGWVSRHDDECIRAYAEWAMIYLRQASATRRVWLKPTLHAVYGMLAARTNQVEFVRRRGRSQERTITVADTTLPGYTGGPRTFTPKIANTIQRGMVEAETRKRSCLLALSLQRRGHTVLSIYADGLLVQERDGTTLAPRVPYAPQRHGDHWRAKETLHGLTYQDETHFRAAELVKWPGGAPERRAVIHSTYPK